MNHCVEVLRSEDVFHQVIYKLKLVNFCISTWKPWPVSREERLPWVMKGAKGWRCPWTTSGELLQAIVTCCYPANTTQEATRLFPTLSFILTFAKVSMSFPFPAITPDCPAALLQDLHLFVLTDTGFEDQFRVTLSFPPVGEAGRTPVHLYASLIVS